MRTLLAQVSDALLLPRSLSHTHCSRRGAIHVVRTIHIEWNIHLEQQRTHLIRRRRWYCMLCRGPHHVNPCTLSPGSVFYCNTDYSALPPTCRSSRNRTTQIHESPPPTAYHTATPVCGGNTVVFLGGGKNWGSSAVIFLLDAVGLKWSSFETAGGINLSGQRYLHTAIAMTGQDIDNNSGDTQVQQGDPTTSPSSQAAAAPGDAASPLAESESIDAAAAGEAQVPAPDVILWNPVGPARRGSVPVSARSGSSEKGAAAAAKKKPGAREGATAAKKAGSKEAAKGSGDSGGVDHPGDYNIDGAVPDVDDSGPPVFERILIFGGIVNEAAVIGVSRGWTQ